MYNCTSIFITSLSLSLYLPVFFTTILEAPAYSNFSQHDIFLTPKAIDPIEKLQNWVSSIYRPDTFSFLLL